eukprot:TRINITY_DN21755_c0_g1_i1.p1 TRINITY_DN21755_c0_g1~~TRINITY_DN21755_c0_g1_i1.p1  ORF type:complete len:256 (+),score=44.85 TRINITY_DN21755_c0_g1_i1:137-904(+)
MGSSVACCITKESGQDICQAPKRPLARFEEAIKAQLDDDGQVYRDDVLGDCLSLQAMGQTVEESTQHVADSRLFELAVAEQSEGPKALDAHGKAKGHLHGEPNFTGRWLCTAIEGDMDAFMLAMEATWSSRTAASLVDYGVGYLCRHISHKGNSFVCQVAGVALTYCQEFDIGRGQQQVEGPSADCWVTPEWEGSKVLRIEQCELDGSLPFSCRFSFRGEQLILHMQTQNQGTLASVAMIHSPETPTEDEKEGWI